MTEPERVGAIVDMELRQVSVDLIVRPAAHDLYGDAIDGPPEVVMEAQAGPGVQKLFLVQEARLGGQGQQPFLHVAAGRQGLARARRPRPGHVEPFGGVHDALDAVENGCSSSATSLYATNRSGGHRAVS